MGGLMDLEIGDVASVFFILLLLCGLIFLLLSGLHEMFIAPLVAEDALRQCQEKGFDTYVSYKEMLFSSHAFGVRCTHALKTYNISGGIIIGGGNGED